MELLKPLPISSAFAGVEPATLLLTTLPLWAPLLLLAVLSLFGAGGRLLRTTSRGGVISGLLGPWAARRMLRVLRRALPLLRGRAAAAAAPGAAALRRSLSSTLSLATASLETSFASGAVREPVTLACFDAFRRYVECMPSRVPVTTEGSEWQRMLEKDTSVMTYRAWRHHLPSGGAEYLSTTVFEGATPQELVEFFNDDAHRMTWDDLLAGYSLLETDARTGAEVVRWVRRFPLMCKQRDYVFSRRSWVDGDTYYTVTHACTHAGTPPTSSCRRVTEFFSSWRMRPVRGRDGGVACEVVLQHFEEMGIQHDLAKLAVRRGMWGCVQNMERGLCAFVKRRRERLRVRATPRRSAAGAPSSPKRAAAATTPRSGERASRPKLLGALLKTGLMAIGGVAVARRAVGAGPQVVGAVGSALQHARHRRRRGEAPAPPSTPILADR